MSEVWVKFQVPAAHRTELRVRAVREGVTFQALMRRLVAEAVKGEKAGK